MSDDKNPTSPTEIETGANNDTTKPEIHYPDNWWESPNVINTVEQTASGGSSAETVSSMATVHEEVANTTEIDDGQNENLDAPIQTDSDMATPIDKVQNIVGDILTILLEQQKDASKLDGAWRDLHAEYLKQQEELRKYKNGYDEEFVRKHILQYVELDQYFFKEISELKANEGTVHEAAGDVNLIKALSDHQILLRQALATSGVVPFEPKHGDHVGGVPGIEMERLIRSENKEEHFMVIEDGLIAPGYMINDVLLREAKVKAYEYMEGGNNE